MVTAPSKGVQWANNQTYPVSWVKGLLDGVNYLDLELTRLSVDGLILIARDGTSRSPPQAPFVSLERRIFFLSSTRSKRRNQSCNRLGTPGRRLLPPLRQQYTRRYVRHLAAVLHHQLWLGQHLYPAHTQQADRDHQRRAKPDGPVRRYLRSHFWSRACTASKHHCSAVGMFPLASDVRWCRDGVVRPCPV
jgi:hypothetical protein